MGYTHVRLYDEWAAPGRLPDLTKGPSDERAKATGTDNADVAFRSGALYGALAGTRPQSPAQNKTASLLSETRFSHEADGTRTHNLRIDSPML
jgi:hypothetical protein